MTQYMGLYNEILDNLAANLTSWITEADQYSSGDSVLHMEYILCIVENHLNMRDFIHPSTFAHLVVNPNCLYRRIAHALADTVLHMDVETGNITSQIVRQVLQQYLLLEDLAECNHAIHAGAHDIFEIRPE